MDWTHLAGFAVVAALLVMSPGPNGMLIAKTVPTSGRMAGFANVAGFVAAFYLHGALAIFGISILIVQSSLAFFIVKMVGALYLLWIGLKALHDAWRGLATKPNIVPAKRKRTLAKAFVEGFFTNALNPKVSMFYLAAFPQFIPVGEGAVESAFALVILHSLINAIWFAFMVMLFAQLARFARGGTFQRWLKTATGLVFVGFGLKLMTLRP